MSERIDKSNLEFNEKDLREMFPEIQDPNQKQIPKNLQKAMLEIAKTGNGPAIGFTTIGWNLLDRLDDTNEIISEVDYSFGPKAEVGIKFLERAISKGDQDAKKYLSEFSFRIANNLFDLLSEIELTIMNNEFYAKDIYEQLIELEQEYGDLNKKNLSLREQILKWAAKSNSLGNSEAAELIEKINFNKPVIFSKEEFLKKIDHENEFENKSFEDFEKEASEGNKASMYELARRYEIHWDPHDDECAEYLQKSLDYYHKLAIDYEYPEAMFELGKYYFEGKYVEKDTEFGFVLISKASDGGDERGTRWLKDFRGGVDNMKVFLDVMNSNQSSEKKLAKLDELLASGIIPKEEYEKGKEKILSENKP